MVSFYQVGPTKHESREGGGGLTRLMSTWRTPCRLRRILTVAFNQGRDRLGPNDFSKKSPITYGRKIMTMLDAIYIRLLIGTIAQKMIRLYKVAEQEQINELSWSFVGHLSNVCRQVLEEEVCSFGYQWLRASMASGMRKAKSNVFEFMADCKPETEDRRLRICSSLSISCLERTSVDREKELLQPRSQQTTNHSLTKRC